MNYILILLGLLAGIFFDVVLAKYSIRKKTRIFGLRIHHTIYGIIAIIFGLFVYTDFLVSFGIGIILSHTVRLKRIVFIEKSEKRRLK